VVAEYNIQLHHKPGVANRADALSRPPGTDEGSEDNKDVIVLPNHLFCCALMLEELESTIHATQGEHTSKLREWEETYEITSHEGIWVMNARAVIPEDQELRCQVVATAHDHATAGHPRIKGTLQLVA
jgi:hypothetical protein